jgi:hypothetical protein
MLEKGAILIPPFFQSPVSVILETTEEQLAPLKSLLDGGMPSFFETRSTLLAK